MEDGKNEIFYDDQTASDTVGASVGGGAWETPKPLLPNTDRELQGISYYCTILHFFLLILSLDTLTVFHAHMGLVQ